MAPADPVATTADETVVVIVEVGAAATEVPILVAVACVLAVDGSGSSGAVRIEFGIGAVLYPSMAPALPVGSGTPVCTTVGLTLSEARGSGCAPSGCVSGAVTMTDSAAGSMRRRRPGVRIVQAVGPPPVLSQFLRVFGWGRGGE